MPGGGPTSTVSLVPSWRPLTGSLLRPLVCRVDTCSRDVREATRLDPCARRSWISTQPDAGDPLEVRIDNHPYDEFVQILEGRLILTLDDGREFKLEQGDSLVVPKGYTGTWHMPEQYRELIVIDTPQE